ncbi:MAG TPA: class I SAM-dependent methyltransferase [Longimicrobium sp.]|jgi:SAM-dependent methyltransferase
MNPTENPLASGPPALQMAVQAYRAGASAASWILSFCDQWRLAQLGIHGVAPVSLRYRVGSFDVGTYLTAGQVSRAGIDAALARVGRSVAGCERVLDFGCGCGRTLLWFRDAEGGTQFHGTDIDAEAIAWCQGNLPFATFGVNQPLPPLSYPDGHFDLVYALSVFTHLSEEQQHMWIHELHRVLRPGGIALLTFLGYHPGVRAGSGGGSVATGPLSWTPWELLSAGQLQELQRRGILFVPEVKLRGLFPRGYGNTYHTHDYIREAFGRRFGLLDYQPRGLAGMLDVAVLEKSGPPSVRPLPSGASPITISPMGAS